MKLLQLDLTLNLLLPYVVTYWHDHVQTPNPQTPSFLGFTPTQATLLATMFYQCLIVDLAPVDSCVVRRYKTSQISQRVTHKSSEKSSKCG